MQRSKVVKAIAAVASLVLVAGVARASHHEVKVQKGKDGSYLTDTKGMALYTFAKDGKGKSACTGPCVEHWPLYSEEKVQVPGGLKASDFGTITREDGKKQTTYKGMPLYYFAKDKAPGDTNGDGVEGWFLAKP